MEDVMLKSKLLGISQGATVLGVSPHTLRRWCDVGRIASHKLGGRVLVSMAELDKTIRESERPRREHEPR